MTELVHMPGFNNNNETSRGRLKKSCLVSHSPQFVLKKTFTSLNYLRLGEGPCSQAVLFLLKVAALEVVRRLSRRRCPFVWHALQSLQLLTFPPFKWIRKWEPMKIFVKGIQIFSRPLMLLSVAEAFFDNSQKHKKISNNVDDSEPCTESAIIQTNSEMRIAEEASENTASDSWLLEAHRELEKHGVILPERINDEELRRFYTAANADIHCFLQSIRRTVRWRETYSIMSLQDLEMWSHLVFWHGIDLELRPCLIVRLGLAFSIVVPHDRPRFVQAIVSQIEHGVLYLVNSDDPRITVLMDCDGISPVRFPAQIMRSCLSLMQDHYPNRLAMLLVTRLPPIIRAIAQTFFQILKPDTRQKVRIQGETYMDDLSKLLQSVPSFLGGNCTCEKCCKLLSTNTQPRTLDPHNSVMNGNEYEFGSSYHATTDLPCNGNSDQVLRAAVIGMLMLWIFVAFLVGMRDPDSFLSLSLS